MDDNPEADKEHYDKKQKEVFNLRLIRMIFTINQYNQWFKLCILQICQF